MCYGTINMTLNSHFRIFLLLAVVTSISCVCRRSKSVVSDGKFNIVGMFPINSENAEGLNVNAVLWAEYFKYAIGQLNKRYPGTLFGYEIYDTCSDEPTKAITSTAMDILLNSGSKNKDPNSMKCDCFIKNAPLYESIGIVGPHSSENALYFNSLLSYERVAQVSYAATSIELTSTKNFYRTVPTDFNQANFIKDVLIKFNWTYVVTLSTDDVYGRSGITVLNDVFKSAGICISTRLTFNIRDKASVESAVETLRKQKFSSVIIFWSLRETVEEFLLHAANHDLHQFVWIVTEATGMTSFFGSRRNQLSGIFLSVVLDNGSDEQFESHFANYTYNDSKDNDWMRMLFHKYNANGTLGDTSIQDLGLQFDFSHIGYVHDSISVLHEAFKLFAKKTMPCDLMQSMPPCIPLGITNHKIFNEKYVNKVSFQSLNGDTFVFDDNGESQTARYNLYFTKKNSQDKAVVNFEKFISWESVTNQSSQISVNNSSFIPHVANISSKCSEECRPGFYPIFDKLNKCCWVCIECSENHVKNQSGQYPCSKCPSNSAPNKNRTLCLHLKEVYLRWSNWQAVVLYIISIVGITTVLGIAIIFKIYHQTPIVRCSNVILSTIQLSAHFLIFLSPLLFIGRQDTINRCSARVYSTGLLFNLITCVSFVKVTHLLNVFKLKYKLTKKEIIHQKTREMAALLCFLLIDVCIAVGMLQTYPIKTRLKRDLVGYYFYMNCTINNHYLVQLAYLLIMQIACAVQAFRGRKLPGRFNEAQYTFFAMFTSTLLMAVSVPLAQSADNQKEESFVISIITLIINLSIVVILYGYKVGLILIYPEENTTEVFQRDRLEKAMNSSAARRLSQVPTVEWRVNNGFTLNEFSNITDLNTLTNTCVGVYDGPHTDNGSSPQESIRSYEMGTVNPIYDESDNSSDK